MKCRLLFYLLAFSIFTSAAPAEKSPGQDSGFLTFETHTLEGWQTEKPEVWQLEVLDEKTGAVGLRSLGQGEEGTGAIRSQPFIIEGDVQKFWIAGADGTAQNTNDGSLNYLRLRSYPDGKILREMGPPGTHIWQEKKWRTMDLLGREVYLEMVDANPKLNERGFAWIGMAGYEQVNNRKMDDPVEVADLFALKIDENSELTFSRSLPFMVALPESRGESRRKVEGSVETIPVGTQAESIFISGCINEGWDFGVAHWGEHPELNPTEERDDMVSVGSPIGHIELVYENGKVDEVPLDIGITAWHVTGWCHGPTHHVTKPLMEPFSSRPEMMAAFRDILRLREHTEPQGDKGRASHYYLPLELRDEKLLEIRVVDNPKLRGRPLVGAVTLKGAEPADNLHPFGDFQVNRDDLKVAFAAKSPGSWGSDIQKMKDLLYTKMEDLPEDVELLDFRPGLEATKIRFFSEDVSGDMLSNIWVANLQQIDEKYDADGFFHESGKDYPFYGGYNGIGTWGPVGVYYTGAFPRCSDHFLSLALRLIENPERDLNYVDLVDKWLYFYRPNHDPEKGPDNKDLNIDKYPEDMPPHWAFVLTSPLAAPSEINELAGAEETDGHSATMVGRWMVWRIQGSPTDEWLRAPRDEVYGKSRWDSSVEAAEFLCWMMDYTGRDVMWCEGETSGWGAGGRLIPAGMADETDPEKIRANYANADMFEPYPTYLALTALRCYADMADAVGDGEKATRWRAYAERLREGMLRLLAHGAEGHREWKQSRFSVLPSLQDSLVQAWFSIYRDGLDPNRLDPEMTAISRNTLKRQLSYPYGTRPVLAMGYGMGWITKAALILDNLDAGGELLRNIAIYSYDKNMDYADPERGIDWRHYQWMIPEGTKLMPDGTWHRIGDLTNGANQGPAMHALELCAGVDDTKPEAPKLLPRVPDPLTAIEVSAFPVLIKKGEATDRVFIDFRYERDGGKLDLTAQGTLPILDVRVGPFSREDAENWQKNCQLPEGATTRLDASGTWRGKNAWWVWVEGLQNVSKLQLPG